MWVRPSNGITICSAIFAYTKMKDLLCISMTRTTWLGRSNFEGCPPNWKVVFSACLREGFFPECWKSAEVIPASKVNPPRSFQDDLRPISLIPTLGSRSSATAEGPRVLWYPFGDLWVTYTVHLWLVGRRVVDFLLVLIEHFPLALTVEALRADISRNGCVRKGVGGWITLSTNLSGKWGVDP